MAWETITGVSAGPMNGDGSRKLLIHDTEGTSIAGAVAAYTAKKSWPTLTVDCNARRGRRVVRHLDDTVAARSLRNDPGGADQTNKDGTVHIQIEIVGFANNRDGSMFSSREDAEWFGREVVGPLCRRHGIPVECPLRWVTYPESAGEAAAQRLSPAQWDAYSGVLGHQHAPDNDHGDPGGIGPWVDLILTAARGDDFMSALTDAEQRELLAKVRLIAGEDPLEPGDIAAGGEARASFKTLFIGALGHGLHEPREGVKPAAGEGDLREPFKELLREVLAETVPDVPPIP